MFFDNYPLTTSSFTKSVFLKGLKTAPAVLLIHGYTGSPYDMLWLGKQLNDSGYTVLIPRLPGHGTNKKDFLSSTWKDWLRKVCEDYIDLCANYNTVYVGGLSMGGILTSLLASRFNPEKIFLCAPAFIAANKKIKLAPFMKYFIKEVKAPKSTFYSEEFYKNVEDYHGVDYVAKVADLYKLQKMSIKNLPYVRSKTLTILSAKDKAVPFSVKNLIDAKLKTQNEYLILEKSGHIVVNDVEKEIVAKRIIEFLKD